jgi:hypothetical protein
MDVISTATSQLSSVFQQFASQPIVYSRGLLAAAFNATARRTRYQAQGDNGLVMTFVSHDWSFPVSLLAAFDPPTPQRGDTITNASGDEFEAMIPSGSEQAFTIDAFGIDVLVHTKRLA